MCDYNNNFCHCDDLCFYYDILQKNNKELKKLICKYILLIESWICILTEIAKYGNVPIDQKIIIIPDELYYLVKNLIPKKCSKHHCSCSDHEYELDPRGKGFYVLCVTDCKCNVKCDWHNVCKKQYKYKLKHISMACLAKYCLCHGGFDYLVYDDILFTIGPNFDINVKINQYVGFKVFFEILITLLE